MSYQISQNKGPKKMGHMGMKKPHINTDNTMSVGDTGKGPLSPSTEKYSTNIDTFLDNDTNSTFGAPYMFEDNSLTNYSNKFMENNKKNNNKPEYNPDLLLKQMNNDINKNETNLESDLSSNKQNINNNEELIGYDNLFSNFDNYGNNRDISLVNNDIINTFQNRFIKSSNNQLQYDIDATGSSVSNKINGSNLNNLNTFESVN
tara:strand:+ start:424 stop:1035 length:612 start_codon:yes stop_codon:yes gene_type:complete